MGRKVRGVAPHERVVGFRKQGQYDEILGSKDWELHLYPVGFLYSACNPPFDTHLTSQPLPQEYDSSTSVVSKRKYGR